MSNANGTPGTLVAAHPGNENRLVHGLYSKRVLPLTEEEAEEVEAILSLPHVAEADRLVAEEAARLRSLIARVDAAIAERPIDGRKASSSAMVLLDHRRRLSASLVVLLDRLGLTPLSRAKWARTLADGSLAERIERRFRELEEAGS